MSATYLASAATDRINNQLLVQLTNDSPGATTINTTRLIAACTDAIGEFETTSGVAYDTSIANHTAVLIIGTLYFLELYKGREAALIESHSKKFYNKCKTIRELALITPSTKSLAYPSQESANSLPDMDRSKKVFAPNSPFVFPTGATTFSGDG